MKDKVAQEPDRIASRRVAWIAGLSLLMGLAGVVGSRFLEGPSREPMGSPHRAPVTMGIVEQSLIESNARGIEMRRAEEAELHRYEWVDRDAGIARIPIERAMKLVEEESPR